MRLGSGYRCVNLIAKIFFVAVFMTGAIRSSAIAQTQGGGDCADTAARTPNQSLSDKLARSNGVICPPEVDPHMNTPAPQGGSTPVIPPPGSPGSNPKVQPK